MTGVATTGERADSYVRREQLWGRLRAIFAGPQRPDPAQLAQVSDSAALAVQRICAEWQVPVEARQEDNPALKMAIDAAECASLYGWALGYARARQEIAAQAGD